MISGTGECDGIIHGHLRLGELDERNLREEWVDLDLEHSWLDLATVDNVLDLLGIEVTETNSLK